MSESDKERERVRVTERDGEPALIVDDDLVIRLDTVLSMEVNGVTETMSGDDLDVHVESLADGSFWLIESVESFPTIEVTPTSVQPSDERNSRSVDTGSDQDV